MGKYFSGLLSGVLLMVAGFAFAAEIQKKDGDFVAIVNPDFVGLWTGILTNTKLDKNLSGQTLLGPPVADDYPMISLSASEPLLEITREDIQRVCLTEINSDDRNNLSVNIFLKPAVRREIAKVLNNRDGKLHSFRLANLEINGFVADAGKAKRFGELADLYPTAAELAQTADDDSWFMASSDIEFLAHKSGLYTGLSLAKYVAGKNELKACDPKQDAQTFPGYKEHLQLWEEARSFDVETWAAEERAKMKSP